MKMYGVVVFFRFNKVLKHNLSLVKYKRSCRKSWPSMLWPWGILIEINCARSKLEANSVIINVNGIIVLYSEVFCKS